MIVCPNCNHQNPDGATQCEACYTPLPVTMNCPSCGSTVQVDAAFCGQCGFDLKASTGIEEGQVLSQTDPAVMPTIVSPVSGTDAGMSSEDIPDLYPPDPLVTPEPIVVSGTPNLEKSSNINNPVPTEEPLQTINAISTPVVTSPSPTVGTPIPAKTQLQKQSAKLLHIRTDTDIELPVNLSVIHIGKPNDRVPPDIDVSGFPDSEVVSRSHADIRIEGDSYYIEDIGSSNGTYVNNTSLTRGNRHKLRPGDRISLGKGDLVSFLFQIS
ncbi:MAG: FHA domain-containing protein [Okeania sp. SIO3H1]|uniref:FHA domain-containing protein n=1 Tax=Okeania sp. SIO1I7 TaxID=2607772 RepID=UPI0013C853B9|nr:FHA domain-containing protein [Okeania sp. SIO1I7]NEN92513.1 FHA domain-containing protein [Okeania sp. SIO3H1]NET24026.1 FHA domain-containing protein [Okeania sp. SIO1I7]